MSDTINKSDIVASIRDYEIGVTDEQAKLITDAVFDTIANNIRYGRKVRISGFGVFEAKGMKARTARNPRTGEEIAVEASVRPAFKASVTLRDFVNGR